MKIKYYKVGKQWFVRISGRNNRIILDAGGYNTKRNAVDSIKQVIAYAAAGDYKIA